MTSFPNRIALITHAQHVMPIVQTAVYKMSTVLCVMTVNVSSATCLRRTETVLDRPRVPSVMLRSQVSLTQNAAA